MGHVKTVRIIASEINRVLHKPVVKAKEVKTAIKERIDIRTICVSLEIAQVVIERMKAKPVAKKTYQIIVCTRVKTPGVFI
jgi:hypothetical protein